MILLAPLVLGGAFVTLFFLFGPERERINDDRSDVVKSDVGARERSNLIRTNTWFSNVYKQFPTEALFALPGAYAFSEAGITIGFPHRVATPATVFGSFNPLCRLGMASPTAGVTVLRSGDWDVRFEIESGSAPWQVHIAQGSPIVTIDHFQGELSVTCLDATVTPVSDGILIVRGDERVIIQGKGSTLRTDGSNPLTLSLFSSEKTYRTILLPQETDKPDDYFASLPWANVVDTRVTYTEASNRLSAQYEILSAPEGTKTLTTLWPHHGEEPKQALEVMGEYTTAQGVFALVETDAFVSTYEIPVLPDAFEPVNDATQRAKIRTALQDDISAFRNATPPGGVYFLGTWLGGLASAVQVADRSGFTAEREELLDILQNTLLANLNNFIYRDDLTMLIAKNTEFGNDEGNDHHFHYGYYLRSASVLVSLRPELRNQIEPVMNELAGDIATTDRASTRYPYLRNFSPYDGHSWADGDAAFGDGNNQESTSEALNAWYGVSLWGRVTDNETLETTGRILFTLELASTKAYWFGENNPFPDGYEHTMASLVWGGKRDYATWFSGQAMHIHGIQWLPITPASQYLATLPNFAERNAEILRAHPNPSAHEWGDLYTAHLSYFDPEQAVRLLPVASKNQAMKSSALLYHTVYRNLDEKR